MSGFGISIELHEEDEPMYCRECGKEMDTQALVLQIGSADQGNITPIQGLCEECRNKNDNNYVNTSE